MTTYAVLHSTEGLGELLAKIERSYNDELFDLKINCESYNNDDDDDSPSSVAARKLLKLVNEEMRSRGI